MSSNIRLIMAFLYPKPGKSSRILELYQPIIHSARDLEPGCYEFQVFTEVNKSSGQEELFTIERFKNIQQLRLHQEGPTLKAFNEAAAAEDLFILPAVVKVVEPATGFGI